MAKNHLGRKNHHAEDSEFEQNMSRVDEEISDQPTRPTHKSQSTKSSKELPRKTK